MMYREKILFQWASGMHLTMCFPDSLISADDEELEQWCDDHCLEVNEFRDPSDVLSAIHETATDVSRLIEHLVKEGELKWTS